MSGERPRVGVVMLLHNRADVALPCLRSLAAARGSIEWELYLLDNASKADESAAVEAEFERLVRVGTLRGRFVRSAVNHGFPKGNNLGLRHFLEQDELTHLCLINSDVLVPDHWLDRLVERCADAVGPVTNACGNEQTIAVPEVLENDERALDSVNARARERFESYRDLRPSTSFLGFFCFLARIELFLAVGLLDEDFGRGAFEDDDYCLRIRARGFQMHVARDVYVHHWGSSSFSRMDPRRLQRALSRNRRRFEAKHELTWESRRNLPLLGAWQDLEHLNAHAGGAARERIAALARSSAQLASTRVRPEPWELQQPFLIDGPAALGRRVLAAWWSSGAGLLVRFLRHLFARRVVLVLGRWFPQEHDLSDGYFQRVLAIDEGLEGLSRIYLRIESASPNWILPRLRRARRGAYELWLHPRQPLHALLAAALALASGRVYVHSVLRLSGRFGRRFYALCRRRVFDVHGVVPEEFEYVGDPQHAAEFGALERWAIERASAVVVVSRAMEEQLRAKYAALRLPPIFNVPNVPRRGRWERADPPERARAGVVYAGGLHKWQQIEAMLDYAQREGARQRFTFLVTQPDELKALHRSRHGTELRASVSTVPMEEVVEQYRRHAFGLALREDVVVNHVACPTKLVEYLQEGLVPIVLSPRIGDFERLGYRCVALGAPLPDATALREMRRANQAVVRRLYREHRAGVEALAALLAGSKPS